MPPATDVNKIVLQPGQFAWCRDEKTGSLRLYVGPVRITPTEDDIFLQQDPKDPSLLIQTTVTAAVQEFIMIKPVEYAVVHNPVKEFDEKNPNGKFTSDKNTLVDLLYGKTRVLTEGYFPVWPGQRVEIRPVHELQSNEYLIARVVDALSVDTKAPFYQLTLDCAGTTVAVVDTADPTLPPAGTGSEGKGEAGEGSGEHANPPVPPPPAEDSSSAKPSQPAQQLQTGQQIVIPGSKTSVYIPPTGIEVVPDTSVDQSGRPITPNVARELLRTFERSSQAPAEPQRGGPSYEAAGLEPTAVIDLLKKKVAAGTLSLRRLLDRAPVDISNTMAERHRFAKDRTSSDVEAIGYALTGLSGTQLRQVAQSSGLFEEPEIDVKRGTVGDTSVEELKAIAEGPRLVRQAVVLGPTEYCVLLDVDGRPQIHKGPGRVFPGPYDRFQTKGSRNRVYDAYHLRRDRGLLLRIVAESISKEDLIKQLPQGLPEACLEKPQFLKGDEIFIAEFDAYLVPSNSFEVIDPETRVPHIGNDHTSVYVQAIGVDQKSGVYVMNVDTGQVDLVKGEKKLVLDPRKKRHVKRTVPARAWNLMIGRAEPHKVAKENEFVVTPWALSIIIPNNEAVLVTSKGGRRVVLGPCTELLGYEEWLEKLSLSSGRPKTEARKVDTCFLRVHGNRVTDQIELETSDFVTIVVDVSYGVTFVGENDKDRFQWFDHRNYVRLLYTHLRSRLRAAARSKTLMELQPIIPEFIRDVVLGTKKEGDEHRPGLELANKMLVDEVEVLEINIPDDDVSARMQEAQRETVIRQIEDANLEAGLASKQLRDKIATDEAVLDKAEIGRTKDVSLARNEADDEVATDLLEKQYAREKAAADNKEELADQAADALRNREKKAADQTRELDKADQQLENEMTEARNQLRISLETELAAVTKELIETGAAAAEKQLQAMTPGLVEALEGLGDKQVLTALAQHLPEAGGMLGFLLGQGGMEAVKKMVAGTALEKVIAGLGTSKLKGPAASEPPAPESSLS